MAATNVAAFESLGAARGQDGEPAVAVGDNNGSGSGNNAAKIPHSVLLRILRGVAVVTRSSDDNVGPVARWIESLNIPSGSVTDDAATELSLQGWYAAVMAAFPGERGHPRQLASMTVAVAFMRQASRQGIEVAPADLTFVWRLIHGALTSPLLTHAIFSASRSAQGFLAVPLCSLVKDGCIDELFRLHVWLPDGQRGNADIAIHSHQPFAQSWILAGEGRNHTYSVERELNFETATHAEYALSWNDGKSMGKSYSAHQVYSTVVNTGVLYRATPKGAETNARDTSYCVQAAAFHRTEVASNVFHATLFFFDAGPAFVRDAGVLGPKDGESFMQQRDPADVTPALLARMVELVRRWEACMARGRVHALHAEWEHALSAFSRALGVVDGALEFPNAPMYRGLALQQLGSTNKRFGRSGAGARDAERWAGGARPSPTYTEKVHF